jgi:hypothetical protein
MKQDSAFLLGLLTNLEDGGRKFLRNDAERLLDKSLYPGR